MGARPGCGFFIAPRLVVTCAHVVGELDEGAPIDLRRWTGEGLQVLGPATIIGLFPHDDIAFISTTVDNPDYAPLSGDAQIRDALVAVGFPKRDDRQEFTQLDASYEGSTQFQYTSGRSGVEVKFKAGQVEPGFSGGPLLNLRTGRVMGVVVATRDRHTDLGGWAVAVDLLSNLLKDRKIQLPDVDQKWIDIARKQEARGREILVTAGGSQPAGFIDFKSERSRHGTVLGRADALAKIEGWLESAPAGWVLIKGGPGTGKSAILSALLDRLEEKRGLESVPHHFVRRGQGSWNEPDSILRNLNVRLEALVKPDGQSDKQGLERLQSLLGQAGDRDSTGDGRLIVVVDGLDEVAKHPGDDGLLRRFLPAYLPDGVWLVCSSRPNYPELGWLEQRSGLHTIDLDRAPWLDDNQEVVKAYWHVKGSQLKPPLDDELQKAAISAAQGNMLHAVTLYDAFAVNPQFRDPNRIPIGFESLLEDMWLRLVEMEDRRTSKHVIEGLGLLAVAGESLPLSTIASLLEWDHPADITDFKRNALQFLLEEHADWHAGEARYRPFHEATRTFLTSPDHMLPQGRRNNHSLLARGLARWPPDESADEFTRQYAARYALMHLAAIGDRNRLAELLGDLRYCGAALKALGPQLLLSRIREVSPDDKRPELAERAAILARVLRLESQWLETYPHELRSLIHNRLVCLGWSREKIQGRFAGFDRGWGLINPVDIGNEICIFRGHTSSVKCCDLDAKGRYGVSGSLDGTARIWDLDRGTSLHVLRPDPEAERCDVDSCALSAEGRYAVTAAKFIRLKPQRYYSRVQVWDTGDGQMLANLEFDHTNRIEVAFIEGNKAIACQASGRVDIHDIGSGTTSSLDLGEGITGGIDIDPTGLLLATVTSRGCSVWELSSTKKLFEVVLERAYSCSFSPDGRSLVVAKDLDSVIVASSTDGSTLRHTDAMGQLFECRLLPNEQLLYTSGYKCELVVWDFDHERAVQRYQGHTSTIDCCAPTPDGRLALTGGGDNTVRLWSLEEKANSSRVDRHEKLVYGCAVNPGGTLACSAPQSAQAVLWNARSGIRIRPIDTFTDAVQFCRFGDGSPKLATLGYKLGYKLEVWHPEGQLDLVLEIPDDKSVGRVRLIHDIAFAKSDLLPLVQSDYHVFVWESGKVLREIEIQSRRPVGRLAGGRAIFHLSAGVLKIVKVDDPKSHTTIADGVRACIGSPNEYSVYALMSNNQLCRLDASSGEVQSRLGEITQEHVSLLIDIHERTLWARCFDGGQALQAPTNEVLMTFSPDGSGRLQTISVAGHKAFGMCFFPDGRLVTAGWDATIRVWDANQPEAVAAVSGSAPFRCVDVAEDRIIAGDQKGNVWFLAPMRELYPAR